MTSPMRFFISWVRGCKIYSTNRIYTYIYIYTNIYIYIYIYIYSAGRRDGAGARRRAADLVLRPADSFSYLGFYLGFSLGFRSSRTQFRIYILGFI